MLKRIIGNVSQSMVELGFKRKLLKFAFIILASMTVLCIAFSVTAFAEASGESNPPESIKLGVAFMALMPFFAGGSWYLYQRMHRP